MEMIEKEVTGLKDRSISGSTKCLSSGQARTATWSRQQPGKGVSVRTDIAGPPSGSGGAGGGGGVSRDCTQKVRKEGPGWHTWGGKC